MIFLAGEKKAKPEDSEESEEESEEEEEEAVKVNHVQKTEVGQGHRSMLRIRSFVQPQ